MKTPTAAATRAAIMISKDCGGFSEDCIAHHAGIIDRQTGLPELIAACQFALQTFNCDPHRGRFNGEDAAIRRLQLALEKAK